MILFIIYIDRIFSSRQGVEGICFDSLRVGLCFVLRFPQRSCNEGGKEGRKARTNEHKKEGRRDGWTDFMKGLDVLIIFKRFINRTSFKYLFQVFKCWLSNQTEHVQM